MIRKLLFLSTLYYSLLLISSCCNCPPPARHRYHLGDINSLSALYTVKADSTYEVIVKRYTPFEKGTFALMVRFNLDYVVFRQPLKTDLLPAAYACKCTFDTYTGLDTPQQIQIRTLNNFDATHPAGSDVTAYFRTIPRAYGQKQQFLPVAAAGTGIQQNDATGEVGFDLYLYEQPVTDTLHYFELNILLQDGRTLTDTTDQVIIRR